MLVGVRQNIYAARTLDSMRLDNRVLSHLELVEFSGIQNTILIRVTDLEYSTEGSDALLLQHLIRKLITQADAKLCSLIDTHVVS